MRRALLGSYLLLSAACTSRGVPVIHGGAERAHAPRELVQVRGLQNIQRTMRLLESSSAEHPNTVRVLFYGQSITQSSWSRAVESTLRRRYPHADLQVENRALGGFASELLVKTAESDLYPAYPDLVIFHVYGAHDKYQDIVRRLRERTTAEVLLQTDHVTSPGDMDEPSDASKLEPRAAVWSAFMNHAFLPGLVERYQTALCDVRDAWKRELRRNGEAPSALLRDEVHLNTRGDVLMAELVNECLRAAPELGAAPAEAWVTTRTVVGSDVRFDQGALTLTFEGNRVDAIMSPGASGTLHAELDGRPPSAWPMLYSFARAHADETGKWPPLVNLSSATPLVHETFQLDVTQRSEEGEGLYTFSLRGDKTGPDGEGRSDTPFVSRSGRVVIEPEDWNVKYAFVLAERPVASRFTVTLRVDTHFADSFAGLAGEAQPYERTVTIASGLPPGRHTLVLRGDAARLRALRVYKPPLALE